MTQRPQPPEPQRDRPSRALTRALVVLGILVPVAMFCLLGAYSLARSRAHYEQQAELMTQNLSAAADSALSANIEKIDFALETIVDRLERQLASGALDRSTDVTILRSEIARNPALESVRITDARGIGKLNTDSDGGPPVDFSDREWFATQRDHADSGLVISRPIVSKVTGNLIVSLSRRYTTANGAFAGTVTAAVPLSYFMRQLSALDPGPHGTLTLRDVALRVLLRYPPPPVTSAARIGNDTISLEFRQRVESGLTQGTYHAWVPADGVERTITFRRLHALPLWLTVGSATDDYLAPWYAELRSVVAACAGVVLLYALASLAVLRLMAKNRRASQRVELLAKVFAHSGEAIMITDRGNRIVEVNPAFTARTGWTQAEVMGRHAGLLAAHSFPARSDEAVWHAVRETGHWRGEYWSRTKDGRDYPELRSVTVVCDAKGAIEHHISNSVDMTDVKEVEARLLHLAHHDALTQLPNRVLLRARLEQALASARRAGQHLAMLFVDMDNFKNINDTLGHPVGDRMLVEVGRRLQSLVRDSDICARLGGDEFVLVLTGLAGDGRHGAGAVAEKLLTQLGQAYMVNGRVLHSTPSIGIAISPADGEDADSLLKNADAAMYLAKAAGRNNFQFYVESINEAGAERFALESGLREAIERGELFLHFQPQLDLRSGDVTGVEALLRWRHPQHGLVPPLKFIPVAEDTGLIDAIGAWALDQALAQLARWRATDHPDLRVAVNLSALQLRRAGFSDQVAQALQRHGLPGAALELEITESVAMHDPLRTSALLDELRTLGVALAIDDFGTGYSSLAYLKQLPLSCLKLDRSFVMDLEHDTSDAAICTATIQLAHSLGLAVVAEGVESAGQLAFLQRLGCDLVQGYYIGKPMDAEDFADFMRRDSVLVFD